MLIPCPECGVEVSEKAPTCPKCGAIIAYPPFYTLVAEKGLNIESLMWDWLYGPLDNLDTTAYGCGQAIGYLCDNTDDDEMIAATLKAGSQLCEAMRNRQMQLSKKSAEAQELELAMKYIHAARDFACVVRGCFHGENRLTPDRIRPNIDLVLGKLEGIKASCKRDDDLKLITSEIEECKKFGAKVLSQQQTPASAPPPISSPKKSGCAPLLIILIMLAAALTYAAVAIAK